jgi:hypothetical protein
MASITISYPVKDQNLTPSFTVVGTCSENHQVTVTINGANLTNYATPENNNWNTTFNDVPPTVAPNTYSITASCGPSGNRITFTVTGITVG